MAANAESSGATPCSEVHQTAEAWLDSTQTIALVKQTLLANFDTMLKDGEDYRTTVLADCCIFPEGTLYPYVLPALAYANLAFSDTKKKDHARVQMSKLIDMAIPQVIQKVGAPQGDLLQLKSYRNHATYLGTLNVALGTFQLATGDTRYAELNRHITSLLHSAIEKQKGYPIRSYPHYSWNFDTIMALASLDVYDRIHGMDTSKALIKTHLEWIKMHGTNIATGLPYSIGWNGSDSVTVPRGCDLSMRICLMSQFAPKETELLYAKYVAAHWIDLGILSGFSEWPKGSPHVQDLDSGPILMGIGSTASSMGLGATIAVGDAAREQKLAQELLLAQMFIRMIASDDTKAKRVTSLFKPLGITPNTKYVTGFLYGDAALFYAITWSQYSGQPPANNVYETE